MSRKGPPDVQVLDMHGMRLQEAEDVFLKILGEVRMKRGFKRVQFITGQGAIQTRFKQLSSENDLECTVQLGNAGVLIVHFE